MATNTSRPTIVVIGAGILGLTSALTLQANYSSEYDIFLVSREFPTSTPGAPPSAGHDIAYASMWAGAHVRPIPIATTPSTAESSQLALQARWLKTTVTHLREQIQRDAWIGISAVPGIEYLEAPNDKPYHSWTNNPATFLAETGLSGFRVLPSSELPPRVVLGFAYETFCINAPLYCTGLLRKFILHGGNTLQVDLSSEWEAYSAVQGRKVALVVNASGTGFQDPCSFPTRGQICVTNLDVPSTITRQNSDGSWSFVIPRGYAGGTIVGGTKEQHEWDRTPSPATRQCLLENAKSLSPAISAAIATQDTPQKDAFRVLMDVVGRRPTREGGVRLEVERKNTQPVVHAYGAGGRGYEMSWGIAGDVAALVAAELGTIKANL